MFSPRHAIKNDALVKADNQGNSSCTSKLDCKVDLVQKCMVRDHGEFESIISGEGAVLHG